MNKTLPRVNARANLCGRTRRIGGCANRNENRKHNALPTRHARNPKNLRK